MTTRKTFTLGGLCHAVAGSPLGLTSAAVLSLVGQGVEGPTDLARALGVTPASMTDSLRRLEAAGLVERPGGAADRRARPVALTAEGEAELGRLTAAAADWDEQVRLGKEMLAAATRRDEERRASA